MNIGSIPPGKNPPEDLNVIIEISMNSMPVKYEINKEYSMIEVDRINSTAMFYPANYGFVPNTLADDGDPIDILVITRFPLQVGSLINVRPIGLLIMEDEGGIDHKVITVPSKKITSLYDTVESIEDLPKITLNEIEHFFATYKDLDKAQGKWSKVQGYKGVKETKELITKYISKK